MRVHVFAVLVALCLNNFALAQGPKPKPKARPPIIVQEHGLIMVMNSVDVTLRMNEAKDKLFKAAFNTTTFSPVQEDTKTSAVTMTFGQPHTISKDLTISNFSISIKFAKEGTYWVMSNAMATLNGKETGKDFIFTDSVLISDIGLYAPDSHSFHCSRFGALYPAEGGGNHSFAIDLNGFQVQPFSNNTESFSQAYECVGFFSIGILSGIFITLILMAVIAWGLAMIMDVKTMDRFDDPKGKPMTFGGTE